MGWFSRWVKKVTKPVIELVVEPIVEIFVEPIIQHVVTPVFSFVETAIMDPVVETLSTAVSKAVNFISDGAAALAETVVDLAIKYVPAVALEALKYWVNNEYNPGDANFDAFKPVDGAELKQHEKIYVEDWTAEDVTLARDVIALSQVAFADFSELSASNVSAVNEKGYVVDQDALYEYENWHTGIESWVQDRYEIIRVQEATLAPFYEANVVLFQDKLSGDYTIGIGGTDGLNDIVTDIALTLFGETPGKNAVTNIIDGFFAKDIQGGVDATVNIVGASLGGAESLLQYKENPDYFDDVFVLVSAGLGGVAGTYYDQNVWDGLGDANITEFNEDDGEVDANDFVTSLGHVGAGTTYLLDEIVDSTEFESSPLVNAHLNHNLWASLPGGEYPDLPPTETSEDVFLFG